MQGRFLIPTAEMKRVFGIPHENLLKVKACFMSDYRMIIISDFLLYRFLFFLEIIPYPEQYKSKKEQLFRYCSTFRAKNKDSNERIDTHDEFSG